MMPEQQDLLEEACASLEAAKLRSTYCYGLASAGRVETISCRTFSARATACPAVSSPGQKSAS